MGTITVPADEAAIVVQRITSADPLSVTTLLSGHLQNAAFNGVIEVVSLSANIAGEDASADANSGNLVLPVMIIGAGVGALFTLLLALCCCCFYRCCCAQSKPHDTGAPDLVV